MGRLSLHNMYTWRILSAHTTPLMNSKPAFGHLSELPDTPLHLNSVDIVTGLRPKKSTKINQNPKKMSLMNS